MSFLLPSFREFFQKNSTFFLLSSLVGVALFLIDDLFLLKKREKPTLGQKTFRFSILVAVLGAAVNILLQIPLDLNPQNLAGKTYLVTGCTPNGIGYETAKALLQWNASLVVCTMRSESKAAELKSHMQSELKSKDLSKAFQVEVMELTDLSSVRAGASRILKNYPKFDGILFNAGLMTLKTKITKDGFDEAFQVNHLSQFLLYRLLETDLQENARVAFVSSTASVFQGYLDKEVYSKKPGGRLFSNGDLNSLGTYADTKLMQTLTARALARKRKDVVFNSLCPGIVATSFQSRLEESFLWRTFEQGLALYGRNATLGAARAIQVLTDPKNEKVTGQFFHAYIPLPMSVLFQVTDENENWLFDKSNELLGLQA